MVRKEKKILTALRVLPSEKQLLDAAAEQFGMTLTDLLLNGARFLANVHTCPLCGKPARKGAKS